jgi:hypothetical protein
MSVATATAIAIAAGVGAAGSIGSGLIGAHAASSAAQTQKQATDQAIAEQQRQFDITQANQQPWLQAGQGALSQLTAGTQPGGSLVTPYGETYQQPAPFSYAEFNAPAPFQAPTLDNTNDPGYQFRLNEGEQALQRGAAASGGAFSGGTLKALARYGQDYASNEYQNVYSRALQGYNTNFTDALNSYNTNLTGQQNIYNTNVANALSGYQTRFNTYNTDQTNAYNRLAALSGVGQTAANTLATTGAANSNAIANLLTDQGSAAAAGTLGSASAWNSALGGVGSAASGALNAYQNGQILNLLTRGSLPASPVTMTPVPYNYNLPGASGG